mgnify:CR=1 FL=1
MKKYISMPMNRVEGDLEVDVVIAEGQVVEARARGTQFRGLERILVGREAMDALVLTPRVCGICSLSHLTAAVRLLDDMSGATVPDAALRLRNAALMAEHLQSDIRHVFLMFCADLPNAGHRRSPLFDEACYRYQPFQGRSLINVIRESKRIVELIAIIGGQWPHTHFMVPGGVTSTPGNAALRQCRALVQQFRSWYERAILGCTIERWNEITTYDQLQDWITENDSQHGSELGFLLRFLEDCQIGSLGRSPGNFLSFGSFPLPTVEGVKGGYLTPAGFARGLEIEVLHPDLISEEIASSWLDGYKGGRHPMQGETRPAAPTADEQRYTWAKAPRYQGLAAETGPLAEMVMARHPLFVDLISRFGSCVLTRELARLARPAMLLPELDRYLTEAVSGLYYQQQPVEVIAEGQAAGLIQAARGALGHWAQVSGGQIEHYQMITPTGWNASPRDSQGQPGALEQALVGTPVADVDNPVEVGHVVRSFDPCLVCAVHAVSKKGTGRLRFLP